MTLYYGPPNGDLSFYPRIDILGNKTIVPNTVMPLKSYAFPIVRRIRPALMVNDLISIQPMTMPIGSMFSYYSPTSFKNIVEKIILKHEAAKI